MKKQEDALKRKLTIALLSTMLLVGNIAVPAVVAEANSLDELTEEKMRLLNKDSQVGSEIENREENMSNLEAEKSTLENEVVDIQMRIDELKDQITSQTNTLNELNNEIKRLQEEIELLKVQIAQREEKLENQARAIQTQGNTTNMIHVIIDSDSLSDLIGRLGVVAQLVGANKEIVQAQIDDQIQLNESENKLQEDKAVAVAVKEELEKNQNEMVVQRVALDNKIIQVAELYDLNAEERASFVEEQKVIAQQTSAINREISNEEERIAEEKRKEAERKVAAEREQQRQIAIARQAKEKEAKEEAERKAAAKKAAADKVTESKPAPKEEPKQEKPKPEKPKPVEKPKQNPSGFIRPSNGYVTSHYGNRFHPIEFRWKLHAGLDIGGGGPIVAAQSGTVVQAQYHSGWGYYVKINHGNGLQTLYAHMQPGLRVSVGQYVSQGQRLGTMGTTGSSTGVHLHFEVYKNGYTVNPAPYLGL